MMASIKKCRVCGKAYTPCRSSDIAAGMFHWQEVACSPACGETYLQQIVASRAESEQKAKTTKKAKQAEPIVSQVTDDTGIPVVEAGPEATK